MLRHKMPPVGKLSEAAAEAGRPAAVKPGAASSLLSGQREILFRSDWPDRERVGVHRDIFAEFE